jgi:hypothetical protein
MSSTVSSYKRPSSDHFQPDESLDPQAQRALRGKLEQIDYIAYAANREVIHQALGDIPAQRFERLAVATAQARAEWAALALKVSQGGQAPTSQQTMQLMQARTSYEELAGAYDGLRRLIERGYVAYTVPAAR